MEAVRLQYCVVPCVAGMDVTSNSNNQFPSQQFINNIAPYTDKIFIPSQAANNSLGYESMNGNMIFTCSNGEISISCSNDNTILKDTEWFKNNRIWPAN